MTERQPLIRDMDLVRGLLLYAAERAQENWPVEQPKGKQHSRELIAYHISIMVEDGLLKGQLYADGHWGMYPPSWKGQDFLQAAQDETVWNQAKEKAGGLFNTLSIDIVMALLKQVLKERLGIELG